MDKQEFKELFKSFLKENVKPEIEVMERGDVRINLYFVDNESGEDNKELLCSSYSTDLLFEIQMEKDSAEARAWV